MTPQTGIYRTAEADPREDRNVPNPGAYWEPKVNAFVATVQPGDFSVTRRHDLVLGTLLGSCVSACICDAEAGIGGLNHFLLPDGHGDAARHAGHASRYGAHAMEMLINEILNQGGAWPRLQAKLFGGANVIALTSSTLVGERNQKFALDFMRREGIPVTAVDMGGEHARRVFFRPAANKVLIQVICSVAANHRDTERVKREEIRLLRHAGAVPDPGGVELSG